jgi:beta-1,2-mannobiose phosphorylase / 1,2-beta-oligomannan phosphorylase
MIQINKEGLLLEKTTLDFESHGVLNPGVFQDGNTVHLFYRAVSDGNYSSIGYCKLEGPNQILIRDKEPILAPEFLYEAHGMEDPRITQIDDLYYLTYTAYDGVNALGALAISRDLNHFEKLGIIVPQLSYFEFEVLTKKAEHVADRYWSHFNTNPFVQEINRNNLIWDKNVVFFPRRIHGKLHFLHRIKPDIQLVAITHLTELTPSFWENYISNLEKHTVLYPKYDHEISYIGGGAPPN